MAKNLIKSSGNTEKPPLELRHFQLMALIRCFEEALLNGFRAGELKGTTHTCIGQEAIAVAAASYLQDDDFVFASHRAHGHYLAAGGDMEALLLEITGSQA